MANLTLTTACNFHCPFCFAAPSSRHGDYLTVEAFARRLDFLERSGIREARLIGGEPTLHPDFWRFVELALERAFHAVVFSHGVISERPLAFLESLPPDSCTVLVNATAARRPAGPTAAEARRRAETLRRLGPRAILSFTIDSPRPALAPLLPLIAATGCRPEIRLGLAQPIAGGDNVYLHPRHYRDAGRAVAAFADAAHRQGVRVHLDCGFVPCMFSPDETERLAAAGVALQFNCNPVLDVGPDGGVIACFPLGQQARLELTPEATAADLRRRFEGGAAHFRAAGVYRECSSCPYKAGGRCPGGCLAAAIQRFTRADIQLVAPNPTRPAEPETRILSIIVQTGESHDPTN
jgi:hypothetical protein